jgi:hypothetical protein
MPANRRQPRHDHARSPPAGRVPVEWIGRARDLIRRIASAYPEAEARRSALIAPFRPHPAIKIFMPKPRQIVLKRLASQLRATSSLCRLRHAVQFYRGRLVVTELWLKGTWLEHDAWTEREQTLALLARKVEIGPPGFTEANYRIAGVGLHALARRFERGGDRTDATVLADILALIDGYEAAVAAGGEFEIAVPGGGRWIGAVAPGEAVAIVRTFLAC